MRPGPRNLITDVEGLLVGNASDDRLKSGVTVVTAAEPFTAAVDVRGGAPGTRETDLLEPGKLVSQVDALVLSGGSSFGLDAASGVSDGLRAQGRGFPAGPARVPIVPAAILFDLANGGAKDWDENPYRGLGRTALSAAGVDFALGTEGAGTGANTATLKGGLGSASLVLDNGATVGAVVAVNAIGMATVPGGRNFLAGMLELDGEFGGLGAGTGPLEPFSPDYIKRGPAKPLENTTIAVVATDLALDKAAAKRMAAIAHDGMARALYPAHTRFDGDLVFTASTGKREMESDRDALGMMVEQAAANCLARAIARAVFSARPRPGDNLPCWSGLPGAV